MAQVGSIGGNVRRMGWHYAGLVLSMVLVLPGCSGKVSTGSRQSPVDPGDTPQDGGDPAANQGTGGRTFSPIRTGGGPSNPIGPGGSTGVPIGAGGAMGEGGGTGGASPVHPTPSHPLCAATGHYDRTVYTEPGFRAKIVGRWMLCSATSAFGTNEAGLEITEDGN